MRFVDYLSTVSGGGYVGARLSYLYFKGDGPGSIERELDTRLLKFLIDGTYLNRPWFFLDRYAIGLLFNNQMIVAALVSAASFIALSFRLVDSPMFHRWLQWSLRSLSHKLGAWDLTPFSGDLYRQFYPAVLIFSCWVAGCAVTYLRAKDSGWLLRALLAGTVVSFFVCLAVLLGDGDITRDESSKTPFFGGKPIANVSSSTFPPILATLVTGLLPLVYSAIRPRTLTRWATRPSNTTGRIIYGITTSSLLFGIPLFAIYFLASENLSGFGTHGIHEIEHLGRFLCGPKPRVVTVAIDNELLSGLNSEPEDRAWCFVSDGAHFDNTAIWPLLQRRCALIFASDASDDRRYQFADLLKLLRRARRSLNILSVILNRREGENAEDLGVNQVRPRALQVVAPPTESDAPNEQAPENLVREGAEGRKDWESSSHYFIIELDYSEAVGVRQDGPERGLLIYLKPSMTLDEPPDLVGYWERHPNFPQDPTVEQFLDDDQVESYRQLGHHIGNMLAHDILGAPPAGGEFPSPDDPFRVILDHAERLACRHRGEQGDVSETAEM